MWSVWYLTYVDIIAKISLNRWPIFLFLDVPTQKLRIIIIIIIIIIVIILATDWLEIILPTARTSKN